MNTEALNIPEDKTKGIRRRDEYDSISTNTRRALI